MRARAVDLASIVSGLLLGSACTDRGAATPDAATDATSPRADTAPTGVDAPAADDAPPAAGDAAPPDALGAADANGALALRNPGPQAVDEDRTLRIAVQVTAAPGRTARVFAEGLPPGARWDEAARVLTFTPDFIQGGGRWQVRLTAVDGDARVTETFAITANDTIRPPEPTVTAMETLAGSTRLTVTQRTDAYLDSPGYAGRTFTAVVIVPDGTSATRRLPVRVSLHGFGGTAAASPVSSEFRVAPHDDANTYWWGYSERLPGAAPGGAVREYTARRVLNLLGWLLRRYPGADPERVIAAGSSMGGAGAMTMGLLHARHFCWVSATLGQAIPRNHRPARVTQLTALWGAPGANLDDGTGAMAAWDTMDLTRALRDSPEAREQFLTLKHGKDDTTIHFGAMVMPSPLTRVSFYTALQQQHVGHYVVWDEGGHGPADPVLGGAWWDRGWSPPSDATASLRRDRSFPAFTACSLDRDPGTGEGNGRRAYNASTGYAGALEVAGDTGWNGDVAGARNRFLRWDASRLVDTLDRYELPLRAIDGAGGEPPRAGYPTTGDNLQGALPARVDVTPRRVQSFRLLPGERVRWTFGAQSGEAAADATGAVTIPRLELRTEWATLVLTRAR